MSVETIGSPLLWAGILGLSVVVSLLRRASATPGAPVPSNPPVGS